MNIKCIAKIETGGGLLSNLNENIPCRELTAAQINSNFGTIFGWFAPIDWIL